jgi:hypothetical protein
MSESKSAVFTITLGYSPASLFHESTKRYYETNTIESKHFYIDQHYPLDREKNRERCLEICKTRGITVLDPGKNLGLHHGFNWALNEINPGKDDIVIAYDPDSYPMNVGWDRALVETIRSEPSIAWATLNGPRCQTDMSRFVCDDRVVAGRNVKIAPRAFVNTTCAWSVSFLEKIGGLRENSEFYGHLEAPMFHELTKIGLKQAFLIDYTESDHLRDLHDRAFQVWKWLHAHTGEYRGDFGQWLSEGMPGWDKNKEVKLP